MKLRIQFGLMDRQEVFWYQPLESFPHIINYLGRNYEWLMYDKDPYGQVDQILIFSEISRHDPSYGVLCPLWNDLFPNREEGCECGAKHDRHFPNFHMRYCKKRTEW